jgi:hypothetical protein
MDVSEAKTEEASAEVSVGASAEVSAEASV